MLMMDPTKPMAYTRVMNPGSTNIRPNTPVISSGAVPKPAPDASADRIASLKANLGSISSPPAGLTVAGSANAAPGIAPSRSTAQIGGLTSLLQQPAPASISAPLKTVTSAYAENLSSAAAGNVPAPQPREPAEAAGPSTSKTKNQILQELVNERLNSGSSLPQSPLAGLR